MKISDYAKKNFLEKVLELNCKGELLDSYIENGDLVSIYQLHDFFVEISRLSGPESEWCILPFAHGYNYLFNNRQEEAAVATTSHLAIISLL